MRKSNKQCFFVNRKRARSDNEEKVESTNQAEKKIKKCFFKIYTNVENEVKKTEICEKYEIITCKADEIVLRKMKEPKQVSKRNRKKKEAKSSTDEEKCKFMSTSPDEKVLDYDKFLEVYFSANNTDTDKYSDNNINKQVKNLAGKMAKESAPKNKNSNLSSKLAEIASANTDKENIPPPLKFKNKNQSKKNKKEKENVVKTKKKRIKSTQKQDIFNINNFIIHPNQIKITQKETPVIKIQIPQFKEIDLDNEEFDNERVSSEEEDTNDNAYTKYHDQYEKREREYRLSLFQEDKKKQKVNRQSNQETESSEGAFKIRIDLSERAVRTGEISNFHTTNTLKCMSNEDLGPCPKASFEVQDFVSLI